MYLHYFSTGGTQNQGTNDQGRFNDADLPTTEKPAQLLSTCLAELWHRQGRHGLFCSGDWKAQ
jgi:hypothetical protein